MVRFSDLDLMVKHRLQLNMMTINQSRLIPLSFLLNMIQAI